MEYQAENRKKYFERFLGREPEETPRTGPFTGSPELNVDFSHPKSRKNPAIVRRRADLIGLTNMLIAQGQTGRVDAAFADRGNEYQCPNCGTVVVLKRGRIITPHFAHKPPVNCDWAAGETIAHMKGKRLIAEAFAARKLKVEMEWVVPALPSYRRADVMVWTKSGKQVAIELQHTSIGLDEIEARAFAYANAGIIQTWIPFLPSIVWEDAEKIEEPERRSEYFVRRYSTRPFEKWIHGFNFGHIMYFDATSDQLWSAILEKHAIISGGNTWYDEWGEEQTSTVSSRWSRRYRELTLVGPYTLNEIRFRPAWREEKSLGHYRWPSGGYIEVMAPREGKTL